MSRKDDNKESEVRPKDGRMPPNDLAAEAAVLSDIILHPPNFDAAASILPSPEAFYSLANRWIYKALAHMSTEGIGVDIVTVRSLLKDWQRLDQVGGSAYLAQIVDGTPAVANVEEHARIVRAKWVQRQAIGIHQRFAAEGYGDVGEPRQWIEGAEKALNDIATLGNESDLRVAGVVLGEHMRALDDAKQRGESTLGVTTGLVDLDKLTGGLYRGDLTVVAGRPGLGKTQFALNISTAVASVLCTDETDDAPKYDNGVAFFSLEMPSEQLAMRLGCTMTKTHLSKARQNRLDDDERTNLWGAANELVKTPLWIDDTPAISIAQLRSRVRKLKRQIETKRSAVRCNRLALVVVDYLQLMTGIRQRSDTREREVASLSAGLKQLAKELDVPVMALSQLNRSVEKSGKKNKRPMLSDLRECVTGDTLVTMADGSKRRIDTLSAGEELRVLSRGGNTFVRAVGDAFVRSEEKRVLRLETRDGRVLRATAEHLIQSSRGGWVPVGQLRRGDGIVVAAYQPGKDTPYVTWDRVERLRAQAVEVVYDVTVPSHGNFVANDIVVHNSGAVENDADNVWFLYRDSYYEKQANPTEAEVIIGKQRSGPIGTVYVEFKREYGKFYNSTRVAPEDDEEYDHIFSGDPNAEDAFDDLDDV